MLGRILVQLIICGCLVALTVAATALGGDAAATATHLYVTAPSRGTVTSGPAGIACGGDCRQAASRGDAVTLVADGGPPGYFPDWSVCKASAAGHCTREPLDCDSESAGQCTLEMLGDARVSLAWRDTTVPTVSLDSPPAKAGPATTFGARARDNSRAVSAVRFYVDGRLVTTDATAPFETRVPVESHAQGSDHRLTARAFDAAGNSRVTRPHRFAVDHQASATFTAPTPADGARVRRVPRIAFRKGADIPSGGVVCRTLLAGGQTVSTLPCSSPYRAQATSDGRYAFQVQVRDDVGNTGVYTRSFTLDRAPARARSRRRALRRR